MRIPLPTYQEPEKEPPIELTRSNDQFVRWYMDCPSWVCECKLTNFGRNKFCAKWTCKKPRPLEYKENEYGR